MLKVSNEDPQQGKTPQYVHKIFPFPGSHGGGLLHGFVLARQAMLISGFDK
jgi:hypothetical protein